jgi:pimeloyl-ACP methyl ester carboxylesterase
VAVRARLRILAAITLTALAASACGGSTTTIEPGPSTAVTFKTADGVRLAGRLFGPADATEGVVLAHMLPADQTSWYPFAERLASHGFRVLTFDFRGYCPGGEGGCSDGEKDIGAAPTDLRAAVAFLRDDGVQRVGIAGASMGGTAALLVASTDQEGIPALVMLSAPQVLSPLAVGREEMQTVTGAKLYIAGLDDPAGATASADALAALGPQPVDEQIVPVDEHGTDLLSSSHGEQLQAMIEQWFEHYLAAPPTGGGVSPVA